MHYFKDVIPLSLGIHHLCGEITLIIECLKKLSPIQTLTAWFLVFSHFTTMYDFLLIFILLKVCWFPFMYGFPLCSELKDSGCYLFKCSRILSPCYSRTLTSCMLDLFTLPHVYYFILPALDISPWITVYSWVLSSSFLIISSTVSQLLDFWILIIVVSGSGINCQFYWKDEILHIFYGFHAF